jgi:hypothetical protein
MFNKVNATRLLILLCCPFDISAKDLGAYGTALLRKSSESKIILYFMIFNKF